MRPSGITTLAYWQFSKAAYLLLVGAVGLLFSRPDLSTGGTAGLLVYIAAHGFQPPVILLPIVAIVPASFGWGLWRLRPWARNILLISSGIMSVRWIGALLLRGWVLGLTVFSTAAQRETVAILVVVDSMIFMYLINTDVKSAFLKSD